MIKDVVIALLTVEINEFDNTVGDVLNKRLVVNELNGILDYVTDIPEERAAKDAKGLNEIIGNLESNLESMMAERNGLKGTIEELELRLKYVKDERNDLRSKVAELEKQVKVKSGLEQYADFIKAIRAYINGKTIKCESACGTCSYPNTGHGLVDTDGAAIYPGEILNGKWTIEGEEE